MVFEAEHQRFAQSSGYQFGGSDESLATVCEQPVQHTSGKQQLHEHEQREQLKPQIDYVKLNHDKAELEASVRSFKMPYQQSFRETDWSQLAEATLPLKTSRYLTDTARHGGAPTGRRLSSPAYGITTQYGSAPAGGPINSSPARRGPSSLLASSNSLSDSDKAKRHAYCDPNSQANCDNYLLASIECRSKQISRKLILVNSISLLINLLLALVAFYFAFANNSSSTTAFAADCVLDFISSAIVLWRYYGDLSDVYMHAREQIACIYLGALFELSALGIIIKASSDILSGSGDLEATEAPGYGIIYLAAAATLACSVLIMFKWSLYKTVRDKSILLDVINTFISTIFAITLCLMTVLSNVDSSFWYFDPVLSIILALFMAGFGLKVIHQNFHVLRPSYHDDDNAAVAAGQSPLVGGSPFAKLPLLNRDHDRMGGDRKPGLGGLGLYESNLNASLDYNRANNINNNNWQKTDYSSIAFL